MKNLSYVLNVDVTVWRCFKLPLDELSLFEKRNEEATTQIYHFWANVIALKCEAEVPEINKKFIL